jgi:hypothetical protein
MARATVTIDLSGAAWEYLKRKAARQFLSPETMLSVIIEQQVLPTARAGRRC